MVDLMYTLRHARIKCLSVCPSVCYSKPQEILQTHPMWMELGASEQLSLTTPHD